MKILPRDAHSAVPGVNVAAIAALPPAAYIPDPEGKSCSAGVALQPDWAALPHASCLLYTSPSPRDS